MAESGKHVIVDGVEFGRVWLFPRLLESITAAMQPGRMIIALFMVVLLIALGRTWDRVTDANVNPAGLVQGRFEDFPGEHQAALAMGVTVFARSHLPSAELRESTTFNVRQVSGWMREGYREARAKAASDDEREQIDATYSTLMRQIESTRPRGDFEATVDHVAASLRMMLDGALNLSLPTVLEGANQTFIQTPTALWKYQTWFAVTYGLAFAIVFAIGGGAISRMAAVQQSREQRLAISEATDFALQRMAGLVWAQVLPVFLLAILAVVVMLVGVLMRVPVLDVITALFYGLLLVLGFLMAFLAMGYVVGFPMLVSAVACENCDGADAMQRAYAYVVNRPLHALWYWAVGLFGLAIGFTIFGTLAVLTLNLTGGMFNELAAGPAVNAAGGYQPGTFTHSGGEVADLGNWHQQWSASLILAWQSLVVCMVAAYVLSYHFTASTTGYLLMRKASDGQETDEVWRPGLIPGTLAPVPPPVGT